MRNSEACRIRYCVKHISKYDYLNNITQQLLDRYIFLIVFKMSRHLQNVNKNKADSLNENMPSVFKV